MTSTSSLEDRIVSRRPLGRAGASGNRLERITLDDGRTLVLKRVSPQWDWISRATGDRGRAAWMWDAGLFDRIPGSIDHATVGVEHEAAGGAWNILMRDVSAALVAPDRKLDAARVRRLVQALAELHLSFWEEDFPELCGLEQRYRLLCFETARREEARGDPVGKVIRRGWDAFAELVPQDVVQAIFAIVERPQLLAEQLRGCAQTLIHGDVRLMNLGFRGDRVVLLDWGERTGTAPPAVELASFLVFDGGQLGIPREQVIAEFRRLGGERFEERALQLALIGGLVQLGSSVAWRVAYSDTQQERQAARDDLGWWARACAAALETWSPV